MNRRDFVQWMGIGSLAASLPVAIAACTPKPKSQPETTPSGATANPSEASQKPSTASKTGRYVAIGTLSELNQKGYLSSADLLPEPIIVIQDPDVSGGLIAVSSNCTHSGCTVAWQEDLFACPCHGSKFNPDGTVVEGPAAEPLETFMAKAEEGKVLVAKT